MQNFTYLPPGILSPLSAFHSGPIRQQVSICLSSQLLKHGILFLQINVKEAKNVFAL